MVSTADARIDGLVFDAIVRDYDRHRPRYPNALVDRACGVAGVGPGDDVPEIGRGSGQLTRGRLARGLHVTAAAIHWADPEVSRRGLPGALPAGRRVAVLLGRPIRSTMVACLVTARRRPD